MRCAAIALLFICISGIAVDAEEKKQSAPSVYLVGGSASISVRKGAYEFDALNLRQDTARDNTPLFGFMLGKRYAVSPQFRFVAAVMFNFGSAAEDTLAPTQYNLYLIKHSFFHAGIVPEFQIAFPGDERLTPIVFAGGGLNFVRFKEGFFLLDDPRRPVKFTADSHMDPMVEKRWCPHAHGGAGFDFMSRRDIGFSVRYVFMFWKPVIYEDQRDMPMDNVPYREYFLTHMLQVQLLFGFEE